MPVANGDIMLQFVYLPWPQLQIFFFQTGIFQNNQFLFWGNLNVADQRKKKVPLFRQVYIPILRSFLHLPVRPTLDSHRQKSEWFQRREQTPQLVIYFRFFGNFIDGPRSYKVHFTCNFCERIDALKQRFSSRIQINLPPALYKYSSGENCQMTTHA